MKAHQAKILQISTCKCLILRNKYFSKKVDDYVGNGPEFTEMGPFPVSSKFYSLSFFKCALFLELSYQALGIFL